jgi:hydroxymethylpyrimidine/phosphomethylpyrimidine kinase
LSAEIAAAVAETLTRWHAGPIVLDPVMVAKSGDRLLAESAVQSLRKHVFPIADLVTPNLPEAAALLDRAVEGRKAMERAAIELLGLGPKAVLLKGGHLTESEHSADVLVYEDEGHHLMRRWFEYPRIETGNTHGTGCTLSSAVAAYLARGIRLEPAVERARAYVQKAIEAGAGYTLGKGHGPVHHFHALWKEGARNSAG